MQHGLLMKQLFVYSKYLWEAEMVSVLSRNGTKSLVLRILLRGNIYRHVIEDLYVNY